MKKLFIIIIGVVVSFLSKAQQYDNKWIIGLGNGYNNIEVDFSNSSNPPICNLLTGINHPLESAATNICDSIGSLAFYTNGYTIWDASHNRIQNDDTLSPSVITNQYYNNGLRVMQGCLILPFSSHIDKYILFHEGVDSSNGSCCAYPFYLYYTTIDMQLNSGLGAVTSINNILLNDTLTLGRITACKHANGRDWWIIIHRHNDATFIKYLLTPNSIDGPFYQTIGKKYVNDYGWAYSAFSPDGNYYGTVYFENVGYKTIELFRFDRCNGMLSDSVYIEQFAFLDSVYQYVGCSFSPNSRYFYVTCTWYVYQYDMLATNIANSKTLVATVDTIVPPFNANSFGKMQLGNDGKIYITPWSEAWLSTIDQPDSGGISCNVLQHNIVLPTFNQVLPNMPNYNLGALAGSPCDTLTGLSHLDSQNEFNVSITPNPASNSFYINYNILTNEDLLFVLFDCYGKEVLHKMLYGTFKNLLVQTNELSDGIYFWNVTSTKNQKQNGKVVIIR